VSAALQACSLNIELSQGALQLKTVARDLYLLLAAPSKTLQQDMCNLPWRRPCSHHCMPGLSMVHLPPVCLLLQINAGIVKGLVEACGKHCPGVRSS
jgi:hypothetical protein